MIPEMDGELIGEEVEEMARELLPQLAMPMAMQRVQTTYMTAVTPQVPRNLKLVQRRFFEECELMGEDAYFSWGSGKDHVEGPSIELALAAARCWGNCAVEQLPAIETATSYVFTSAFIDLETGYTLTRQFRQSRKWTVSGKMDEERKEDIRFQIGQSKAIRNVVVNALRTFVNLGLERSKLGVRNKIEKYIERNSIEAARQLILGELKKVGIAEGQVLAKFEYAAVGALTVDDMVRLRGDLKAIQVGEEAATNLFPPANAAAPKPSQAERMAEKLAPPAPEPAPGPAPAPETNGPPITSNEAPAPAASPTGASAEATEAPLGETPPESLFPQEFEDCATQAQVQQLRETAAAISHRTAEDVDAILKAYRDDTDPDHPLWRLPLLTYETCCVSLDRQRRGRRSGPSNAS